MEISAVSADRQGNALPSEIEESDQLLIIVTKNKLGICVTQFATLADGIMFSIENLSTF